LAASSYQMDSMEYGQSLLAQSSPWEGYSSSAFGVSVYQYDNGNGNSMAPNGSWYGASSSSCSFGDAAPAPAAAAAASAMPLYPEAAAPSNSSSLMPFDELEDAWNEAQQPCFNVHTHPPPPPPPLVMGYKQHQHQHGQQPMYSAPDQLSSEQMKDQLLLQLKQQLEETQRRLAAVEQRSQLTQGPSPSTSSSSAAAAAPPPAPFAPLAPAAAVGQSGWSDVWREDGVDLQPW